MQREIYLLIGQFLGRQMQETKYGYSFDKSAVCANINRLTNQLWKLIPMREHDENWQSHLKSLIVEISGLGQVFLQEPKFISLLSKLEGIYIYETEFVLYRKNVFEAISLLREIVQ